MYYVSLLSTFHDPNHVENVTEFNPNKMLLDEFIFGVESLQTLMKL
jgi:hypothetical protein